MHHSRTSRQEDESAADENQAPNHQARQHDSNLRSSHQNTQMGHSNHVQASQSKQRDVQKISSNQNDAKIGNSTTKGLFISGRQNDLHDEKSDPDLKKGAKAEQRTPSYLGQKAFSQNSDKKEPIENESWRNPEEDNDNIQSRKMKDDVVMADVDQHSAPEEIAPANPSDAVQGHNEQPAESEHMSSDDELECNEKYDQFNALTPIQQMHKKDSVITFCGLNVGPFAKKSNRHQMSNQNDSVLDDTSQQLGKIISPYIKPPKSKLNIPMTLSPFSPLYLRANATNQISGHSPQKISKIKSAMQNKQSCQYQPSVLQAIWKTLAPPQDQARAKLGATINDRGLNAILCSQSNDNVHCRSHRKNSEFTPLDLQQRQDSRIMNAQTIGNEELQFEEFASPYVQKRPNFNPSFNPFNGSHGKIGKGSKKSSSDNGLDTSCYQNHPPELFSETIMKISSSPHKKMKGSSTKDKNAVGIKREFIQTPAKRRTSAQQSPNVGSNLTSKIKTSIDNITPAKEKTINGVGTDCKNALSSQQQNQFRLKTNGGSIVDSNFKINKNSLFKGVLNSEKSKNRSHCHKSHKSNRVEKLNYDQEGMSNTKAQLFNNQGQPSFVSKLDYGAAYNSQQLMTSHYQNQQQFYPQSIQHKSQEKLNKNVPKLNHPQSALYYKYMQMPNLAYMNSMNAQLNNGNFQQNYPRKYGPQCLQNQPSSIKNKPEIGNMEGIAASASPEFAHQMINQNTISKQHRSTGHSNNDESPFKEENQDNHSINHIMPKMICIGGQFKNNNDMGLYPSISPQKNPYSRMLEGQEQQMFSPDQLNRKINIHSTNKKSKWSSNFKKTGQIDMNDQNTPLKDSPYLIRRQSKTPGHIDFQNLRDSSESKGIVNHESSGFSGSGSGGSSSSSDENGGPSSSSNQENSQMSLNKIHNCQQPNQYTFLYENGLFKYMQPPNYKAQSVYPPGFHPTPELHLPGCQFKCTCGLWQAQAHKGTKKTMLNSSSKKAKQQDSDKAQMNSNQRKCQDHHAQQEAQESPNLTNESKKRSHSTENNISIYHNPQINITSQNIITGCHGRPVNMNYQQHYAPPYMNQYSDMGQFFSQMAPQNPNVPMMPFFNGFMPNFQQVKNFVSQNQQSGFNHYNQQSQNLNNQTNTKTSNTKVEFDFSEENQANKKQNKKNQQATELSKRMKNSQKLPKKEKQQKKDDQIQVEQLNNATSIQFPINEELEGSNNKRIIKQKSKSGYKKLAQKDPNVKLLQDLVQQAEIEDAVPGGQTAIVQQMQVDDIDKATQKQTNEQQESNAYITTNKKKLSTTNITPQKSNMESLALNKQHMMSFGIDGRPSAGAQLFESTQKIQHTVKGKNTAEKQGSMDRSIFDSGIKDHIFKTPNSQDKIQRTHYKTNLKERPGVGNLDKKHPLEEFDATTSQNCVEAMYLPKPVKCAPACQTSQKKRNNPKKQLNSNVKTQNPNRLSVKEKELENQLLEKQIKEKTDQIVGLTITQDSLIARKKLQPGLIGCQGCKCKNSKCLKLYCECLRNNATCGPECQCHKHGDCFNDDDHKEERKKAIEDILKRNIKAFESKVDKDKNEHFKGCNCKNSMCQKKYCECFERGVPCTGKCKCQECRNTGDSTNINLQGQQSCERHQDTSLNDNILSDIKKEITKEGNTLGDSYQKSTDQKMQIDLIQTADKIQQKNQIDQQNIQIERPFDPSLHDEVQNVPINPDPNASKGDLEMEVISAGLLLEEDGDAFIQNKRQSFLRSTTFVLHHIGCLCENGDTSMCVGRDITEINQQSPIILEEKDEKMQDESVNVGQSQGQRGNEEAADEDESVSQIQNSNTDFLEIHEVSCSQKLSVQSQYNQVIRDDEDINQSRHSQAAGRQHRSLGASSEENAGTADLKEQEKNSKQDHDDGQSSPVEIPAVDVASTNQEHQVAIQDQESDDEVMEQQALEQELPDKYHAVVGNEEVDMKQYVVEEDAVIEEAAEQHDEEEQAEEPQQAQEVSQYKKKNKLPIGKQSSRHKKHQDESSKEKPLLDSTTRNLIKQSQNGKKTAPRLQSQSSMNQNDTENLEPLKAEKKESMAEATAHKKDARAQVSPIKTQKRQSKRIQQKRQEKQL